MKVLLISCVISAGISVPSYGGDGIIVTGRNVQGHMAGRASFGPDPYPTTVNANPNRQILSATGGELSDAEFSGVSSGSSISRAILPTGNLPGLENSQNSMSTLGAGPAAGRAGGSQMAGQISNSIQRGLAPLNAIGSALGGQ